MTDRRITHLKLVDEKLERLTENGILVLNGEIDESESFVFCLEALNIAMTLPKSVPLLVILNSPGGSVDQGLAIYDCIKALVATGREVHIWGLGLVASMGTVILQAGTKRLSAPNAQYLVHQVSRTIGFFKSEETTQLREQTEEIERLNDIVLNIIADRSGIELTDLKKLCIKTDYWMGPEKARKLGTNGLMDEVTVMPAALSDALKRARESHQTA